MTPSSRRQREIAHAREDILEAASRAFMRAGYAHVTVQDIAREAGYTAASLYTYFRSKEEIVEGLIDGFTAQYIRLLDEPLPLGLSFQERFETMLGRQFEVAERQRPMFLSFQAIGGKSVSIDKCIASRIHESFQKRIRCLRDWLTKNAGPKDLGRHDPELVAQFLFGAVQGVVHAWMLESTNSTRLLERLPSIVELFIHGVSGPATHSRKHNP